MGNNKQNKDLATASRLRLKWAVIGNTSTGPKGDSTTAAQLFLVLFPSGLGEECKVTRIEC